MRSMRDMQRLRRRRLTPRRARMDSPKLLIDWHNRDEEIHPPTWYELFYDLLLVAAFLRMGNFLKSDPSWTGVFRLIGFTIWFWIVWLEQAGWTARFSSHDAAHRGFALLSCACLLGMAAHVPVADGIEDNLTGFAAAFTGAMLTSAVQKFEVYRTSVRAHYQMGQELKGIAMNITLMWTSVALVLTGELQWTFIMWVLAPFVSRIVTNKLRTAAEAVRIPVHVEHFSERHGELVMLLLGESVISLAIPDVIPGQRMSHYAFLAVGVALLMQLQTMYFEAQPNEADMHALRFNMRASGLYVFSHFFYFASLIMVGVGLKILLLHLKDELHAAEAWILCAGTSITIILIHLSRLSHKRGFESTLGGQAQSNKRWVWTCRIIVAALPLFVPIGVHLHALSPIGVVAILAGISLLGVILDTVSSKGEIEVVKGVEDDPIVASIMQQAAIDGGRALTSDEVQKLKKQYLDAHGIVEGAEPAGRGDAGSSDEEGEVEETHLVLDPEDVAEEADNPLQVDVEEEAAAAPLDEARDDVDTDALKDEIRRLRSELKALKVLGSTRFSQPGGTRMRSHSDLPPLA